MTSPPATTHTHTHASLHTHAGTHTFLCTLRLAHTQTHSKAHAHTHTHPHTYTPHTTRHISHEHVMIMNHFEFPSNSFWLTPYGNQTVAYGYTVTQRGGSTRLIGPAQWF